MRFLETRPGRQDREKHFVVKIFLNEKIPRFLKLGNLPGATRSDLFLLIFIYIEINVLFNKIIKPLFNKLFFIL